MKMKENGPVFGVWVLLAAMITVMAGLVYGSAQGVYRQSANDPQVEIAQEVSDAIAKGAPADQIIPPSGGTDIKNSLSAFAIIYDKDGKVLGSSGKLNEQDPVPPTGVFENAKKNGRNILTWQPEKDVRIAAVVVATRSGDNDVYVLAGKNLREVEKRINSLTILTVICWAVMLVLAGLLAAALVAIARRGSVTIVEENTEVVVVETPEASEKTEETVA